MTHALLALVVLGQVTAPRLEIPASFLDQSGAVGVSVAVLNNGKLWEAQAGYADRDAKLPVTPRTLFRLGSISKPVTAAITMRFVERGKLNLDEPASRHIFGFNDRGGQVTLRRLLSHTAGIRHYMPNRPEALFAPLPTSRALDLFSRDPLIADPGTKYSYSTHAFTLVAAAIEDVADHPFPQVVRSTVGKLAPSLACEVLAESKPERTSLYTKPNSGPATNAGKRENLSWKFGGGGMESAAGDLARFGDAVMRAKFLKATSRDQMWTAQDLLDGTKTSYGLGWAIGKDGTRSHNGGQQGCSTSLIVDPSSKTTVVVLANTSGVGNAVSALAGDLLSRAKSGAKP